MALNAVAWALATDADPALRDPEKAVAYARRANQEVPGNCGLLNTLGAALYAAGDYEESVRALKSSLELEGGDVAENHLLMAMATHRLGREGARAWYEKAVRWIESHDLGDPNRRADLEGFRREAGELLGIQPPGK